MHTQAAPVVIRHKGVVANVHPSQPVVEFDLIHRKGLQQAALLVQVIVQDRQRVARRVFGFLKDVTVPAGFCTLHDSAQSWTPESCLCVTGSKH